MEEIVNYKKEKIKFLLDSIPEENIQVFITSENPTQNNEAFMRVTLEWVEC